MSRWYCFCCIHDLEKVSDDHDDDESHGRYFPTLQDAVAELMGECDRQELLDFVKWSYAHDNAEVAQEIERQMIRK